MSRVLPSTMRRGRSRAKALNSPAPSPPETAWMSLVESGTKVTAAESKEIDEADVGLELEPQARREDEVAAPDSGRHLAFGGAFAAAGDLFAIGGGEAGGTEGERVEQRCLAPAAGAHDRPFHGAHDRFEG